MVRKKTFTRRQKFCILALIPIYFIIVGLFVQPLPEIIPGLLAIIKEPDFLITDYFIIGGIGASLINAGLLTLVCISIIYHLNMEMDGHTITSCCLMFGFSLFGKNLINIWTILIGVYLYSRYHKMPLSKYIYVGFYGTSLSPIITQIMYIRIFPFWNALLSAYWSVSLLALCCRLCRPMFITHIKAIPFIMSASRPELSRRSWFLL